MRVSFFRQAHIFLNFYLPLGFLSSPFSLANAEILYIFRELLSSYFINIVVRVYTPVHRGQGADWAVQTSNGGENEKKFPCLEVLRRIVPLKLFISMLSHEKYSILSVTLFEDAIFNKRT